MTNATIEAEIVKLVNEIRVLEKKAEEARANSVSFKTPSFKEQYRLEAEAAERSIDRKMQLLMILKG